MDGQRENLQAFVQALRRESPAAGAYRQARCTWQAANGFSDLKVLHSRARRMIFCPYPRMRASAGLSTRAFRPRRPALPLSLYQFPTPRAALYHPPAIPYDRPNATMAVFELCRTAQPNIKSPRPSFSRPAGSLQRLRTCGLAGDPTAGQIFCEGGRSDPRSPATCCAGEDTGD